MVAAFGQSAKLVRDSTGLPLGDCAVGPQRLSINRPRFQFREAEQNSAWIEASLGFLGLGIQPPNPGWGAMLARACQYMEIAPERMYALGLAIPVVSLAFNALGESLRIALDPTTKG